MIRIEGVLRGRRFRCGKALVPFFLYGYPERDTFEDLLFTAIGDRRGGEAIDAASGLLARLRTAVDQGPT